VTIESESNLNCFKLVIHSSSEDGGGGDEQALHHFAITKESGRIESVPVAIPSIGCHPSSKWRCEAALGASSF